jgi:uncharacterized protein (DUF2252 family)
MTMIADPPGVRFARCGRFAHCRSSSTGDADRVEGVEREWRMTGSSRALAAEMAAPGRSTADRAGAGKQARASRPRSSFAGWTAPADRTDPIGILEEQGRTRVAALLPIRYGRMAASPFSFYRGAAAIMASDLGRDATTGLVVQLCGDAHLENFGGFAAPDRQLLFGINDFDETHPGPFEWDVLRLAASFEIAARQLGMSDAERRRAVHRVVRAYRGAMRSFAAMTELDVWHLRLDLDALLAMVGEQVGRKVLDRIRHRAVKAHHKDRYRALDRLTERVDGQLRFVHDPPLIVPAGELFGEATRDELDDEIRAVLIRYRSTLAYKDRRLAAGYAYHDLARKVVGVGSVGTRAWVILLLGRDDDDPLFLQAKQAEASVLEAHTEPSTFSCHGERVVAGQSLMQAASDEFLGWDMVTGTDGVRRDYYLRQLWDWKASPAVETMDPTELDAYAHICGWTLARSHARTGDRIAIASYLGKNDSFERAIAGFAVTYADQNERDHAALLAAIEAGRLPAEPGV